MSWISIENKRPLNGDTVLVIYKGEPALAIYNPPPVGASLNLQEHPWLVFTKRDPVAPFRAFHPKYWMPIPPAPPDPPNSGIEAP